MASMFEDAVKFDKDLLTGTGVGNTNKWNTAAVKDMSFMFKDALAFNKPIKTANTNNWQTTAVENMASMFENAKAFNSDITNWDTAAVTNMASMFQGADVFNQDIKKG